MQPDIQSSPRRNYPSPSVLLEMYESEFFDSGLVSFEYPLYHADDEELDYFFGSIVRRISRATSGVAKTLARTGVARTIGSVAKSVGQGINTASKFVPMSVLTSGLAYSPIGMATRAGMGALSAAAEGRNVFHGAVRSMASSPLDRVAVDAVAGIARGENVFKSLQRGALGAVGDVRESLRFAAMVAPFVPGLGTGVAAALGVANALASGERITDAIIAGARNAVPGGAIAQAAFDAATRLARGQNLRDAMLDTFRSQLPGGPMAQAAFDAGLALAKGKNIQDSIIAGGGRLLPKSPFAADVMSFVNRASRGENLKRAALSSVGNLVMRNIEQRTAPMISKSSHLVPFTPQRPARPAISRPRSRGSLAFTMR